MPNKHHSKKHSHKPSHKAEPSDASDTGSDEINTEAQNEGVHSEAFEAASQAAAEEVFASTATEEDTYAGPIPGNDEERQKIHLDFYGSEILRAKAPKVMEVADQVADEWVQDGQFESIQLGNPLADHYASKALRKAKDVEKKLEEKGVFMMAKIGIDYAKSKLHKK